MFEMSPFLVDNVLNRVATMTIATSDLAIGATMTDRQGTYYVSTSTSHAFRVSDPASPVSNDALRFFHHISIPSSYSERHWRIPFWISWSHKFHFDVFFCKMTTTTVFNPINRRFGNECSFSLCLNVDAQREWHLSSISLSKFFLQRILIASFLSFP